MGPETEGSKATGVTSSACVSADTPVPPLTTANFSCGTLRHGMSVSGLQNSCSARRHVASSSFALFCHAFWVCAPIASRNAQGWRIAATTCAVRPHSHHAQPTLPHSRRQLKRCARRRESTLPSINGSNRDTMYMTRDSTTAGTRHRAPGRMPRQHT